MKKGIVLSALVAFIALAAFRHKPKREFNVPDGWPKPAYDFKKNPLSENKIELGRRLFYDPVLSKDSTISCNSCHLQYTAFTHIDHPLSHGIAGRIGTRNSPALMNLAWNNSFMWDGAVNHLDMQALAPISNHLEMDETITNVVGKLQNCQPYPGLFYKAFGDSTITGEFVLKSISQFMLTLVSANSKYDKVKRGEDTFNTKEANGYKLFRQHCSLCHTEPLFTNHQFENNGLMVDTSLSDYGHIKVTHQPTDSLKFKVPTLRNIEFSAPYMHDGRFKTLSQVLNNYIMGVQLTPTLNPALRKGIYLSPNEKVDVIAFLLTLSDREFLFNPKFGYPKK
jgi:cytochrome c peroxidase